MVHLNGEIWRDTAGEPIQAHGGGILHHQGVFYWYGEHKGAPNAPMLQHPSGWLIDRVDVIGIACYSSTNLVDWKNEGLVLAAQPDDPTSPLHPGQVCERPKVVWDPLHQHFLLRWHCDDPLYLRAEQGIATSPSPTGPFEVVGTERPWGEESRDMTLFVSNGEVKTAFSCRNNATLFIGNLATGESVTAFENDYREAPALFYAHGRWWLLSSGCTGWDPNPARLDHAEQYHATWTVGQNPCLGPGADETWGCQSTFVLEIPGENRFIALFDKWRPKDLQNSGYAWLEFDLSGETPTLTWIDHWRGL